MLVVVLGAAVAGEAWSQQCSPFSCLHPSFLPNAHVGVYYSEALWAEPASVCFPCESQIEFAGGSLPPGMSFVPGYFGDFAYVYGTPTAAGSSSFDLLVSDACGNQGSLVFFLDVDSCPLTISPAALPAGNRGFPYRQALTATGTGNHTFSLYDGCLPDNVGFSSAGVLSGTPIIGGVFYPDVMVSDAAGCGGNIAYVLRIQTCAPITISPSTLPDGMEGSSYSQLMTASGGSPAYAFSLWLGTLPPGISMSPTGQFAGTPTSPGTFDFGIQATDTTGCYVQKLYRLIVRCAAALSIGSGIPDATVAAPYRFQLTASGGTPPYGFALASGSLPPGLTLDPGGEVMGTPIQQGSYGLTIQVTDARGCTGTLMDVLEVKGRADLLVGLGHGPSNPCRVRIFDLAGTRLLSFLAYATGLWGVNVASGDLNRDLRGDILTGPGPDATAGPLVRDFDDTGTPQGFNSFLAYGTARHGVNLSSRSIDADPNDELLTGPGPGMAFGPQVRGFNYDALTLTAIAKVNFYAYGTLNYGVQVAGADVEGDGFAEIITAPGPGPSFAPHVRGFNFDGTTIAPMASVSFWAFGAPQYGARAAGGDVDGDAFDEIAATPGPGPAFTGRFRGFDVDGGPAVPLPGFDIVAFTTFYGGHVALGDADDDAVADLVAAAGPDAAASSRVQTYDYDGSATTPLPLSFLAFPWTSYGVTVASGNFGY